MGAVVMMVRRGAPPQPETQCLRILPTGFRNSRGPVGRWMYLIGLRGGDIKVGMTQNPRERLMTHWRAAGGLEWAHLFPRVSTVRRHGRLQEAAAIEALAATGRRIGRTERFRGISKAQAIACVRAAVYGAPEIATTPEGA